MFRSTAEIFFLRTPRQRARDGGLQFRAAGLFEGVGELQYSVFSERRATLVINFGQSFLSDESWFPKVPPNFIGEIVL